MASRPDELVERAGRRLRTEASSDVDTARIQRELERAEDPYAHGQLVREIADRGFEARLPASRQRDLPGRAFTHDLGGGTVQLGSVASRRACTVADKNPRALQGAPFGLDVDVLRTSLLVVGPPGSGKTHAVARPLIEHLALQSLAGAASVVVLDPKGDDFALEGWFDHTIDLTSPTSCGFSLFGGSDDPALAADRLASALVPRDSAAFFVDSAKNALNSVLGPFHAAHRGRWPTVRELLGMLTEPNGATMQGVRERLKNQGRFEEFRLEMNARERQVGRRDDSAAGLTERIGLLNRPHLTRILDGDGPRFEMSQINRPTRVRIALPEAQSPDAVRILARLAIAQFIQVVADPRTNREIFKGLVCDEASRFIDSDTVAAVRQIRSNNAGLALLTQGISDIPADIRDSLFTSTGCKAVFAGLSPSDARLLSEYWGTRAVQEKTRQSHSTEGWSVDQLGTPDGVSQRAGYRRSQGRGTSVREVDKALWSPSEITNAIPAHHAVFSLARSNGHRSPALLVDLRR